MLSRRSVRIKVMQLLFALNRDQNLTFEEAKRLYWKNIDRTFDLYLFNLFNLTSITEFAFTDEKKRKAKHLPSDEDKQFTAKLYQNDQIGNLQSNKLLQNRFRKLNFDQLIDRDYCKRIYNEFAKEEVYINYLKETSSLDDHLNMLLELFRFCRKDEFYNELMEDHFPSWTDDKSIVVGAVKKTLKMLPAGNEDFYEGFYPDDETIKEFGEKLLIDTHQENESLLEYIKPTLKNWDHDRLAVIDMILIKMAIAEFIHFKTIPTKVTLNEYVEISKQYSTAKSKDFINGILDRLLKELTKEDKINKEGRGLMN